MCMVYIDIPFNFMVFYNPKPWGVSLVESSKMFFESPPQFFLKSIPVISTSKLT